MAKRWVKGISVGRALSGTILLVAMSGGSQTAAQADVYVYEDDQGVRHFTRTPGPNRELFLREDPRETTAPSSSTPYEDIIQDFSRRKGIDPALVKAIIHVESNFDPAAVSNSGAQGLMQLMPLTTNEHGVRDAFDPHENIRVGVKHLRRLLDRFGNDLRLVLAAYNAGTRPVRRYGGIPPYSQTRSFVERVLRLRKHYQKTETRTQSGM